MKSRERPNSRSKKPGRAENTANLEGSTKSDCLEVKESDTLDSVLTSEKEESSTISLPYYYFGIFDGHAGWGAAVSAANQLHHILHVSLL